MKKRYIIAAALCLALLNGCNKTNNEDLNGPTQTESPAPVETMNPEDNEIQGIISDFVPFEERTQYIYTGASDFDQQEYYTVFVEGNVLQRKLMSVGNEVTEVLEYKDGELSAYASSGHWSEKPDPDAIDDAYKIVVLKEPLALGNSWETFTGPITVGRLKGVSTITGVDVPVETPYGTFEALEVTTEYEGVNWEVSYYVKDIGLVMMEYHTQSVGGKDYKSNTVDTRTMLAELNRDVEHEFQLEVYYPDDDVIGFETGIVTGTYATNGGPAQVLESVLRQQNPNGSAVLISENTKVNAVEIDREKDVFHIDFSKEFVSEMNAGAMYESMIIDAIGATIMNVYPLNNVWLTVEGSNYESGHIFFEDGQYLTRDDVVESILQAEEAKAAMEEETEAE